MITNNIITKLPFQQMDFAAAHERYRDRSFSPSQITEERTAGGRPATVRSRQNGQTAAAMFRGSQTAPRASEMLNIGRRTFTPEAVVPVADDAPVCRGGDRSKPEIFAEGFLEKAEKKEPPASKSCRITETAHAC